MLAEDVDQKYRFAVSRLSTEENRILAASLPGAVTRMLQGNELYQYYIGDEKKKRGLLGLGRKERKDAESITQAFVEEARITPLAIAAEREIAVYIENEKEAQPTKADFDSQEEDMLQVMDRYRTYYIEETQDLPNADDGNVTDLIMAMGTFLKQIDE